MNLYKFSAQDAKNLAFYSKGEDSINKKHKLAESIKLDKIKLNLINSIIDHSLRGHFCMTFSIETSDSNSKKVFDWLKNKGFDVSYIYEDTDRHLVEISWE